MDVLVLRLLKVSWPLESLPLIDLPDFLMHIKGLGINQDTGIDNLSVKSLKTSSVLYIILLLCLVQSSIGHLSISFFLTMEKAVATLLHQGGDREVLSNISPTYFIKSL